VSHEPTGGQFTSGGQFAGPQSVTGGNVVQGPTGGLFASTLTGVVALGALPVAGSAAKVARHCDKYPHVAEIVTSSRIILRIDIESSF
jgi:hypothetical protein